MKKLLIGATLGCIIGAGGLVGLAQIPNVRDLVLRQDTSSSSSVEVNDLKQENSTLKTKVDMLNADLTTTKSKLSDTESALTLKEQEVSTLTSEKADLQIQLDSANAEIEQLKGLVGSDTSQLLETITSLTNQLNAKTQELNTATAELEQLRVDKETLITRVSELETRLAEVEEELANYKSLGDIDILNTANYNGTWYKDGKFEDLYTITNGNVVHNQNEDTGHLVCMYNQMYLSMVSGGYVPVTLSLDGNSFTTEDGTIYSKFYLNIHESVVSNLYDFSGLYQFDNKSIELFTDNTLKFIDGDNVYYGAFTSEADSHSVGGNSCVIYTITARININDVQQVRVFEITRGSTQLVDKESNTAFELVNMPIALLTDVNGYSGYKDCLKVVLKTSKPITIESGKSVSVIVKVNKGGSVNYNLYVNGQYLWNNTGGDVPVNYTLYNNSENDITTNMFEFNMMSGLGTSVLDIVSISGIKGSYVSVDIVGSPTAKYSSNLLNAYNTLSASTTINYVSCDTIFDYINGSYTLTDSVLLLSSDSVIITPTDSDSITATSYSVIAKTDGFDIYQTATITYVATELVEEVETEVTHTIVINYKNNNVISCKIDNVSSEIFKN